MFIAPVCLNKIMSSFRSEMCAVFISLLKELMILSEI